MTASSHGRRRKTDRLHAASAQARPHDKRRKKRRKTPFDLLALALLLTVAAIPVGHWARSRSSAPTEEVTLTLRLNALLPEIAEAIGATDTLAIDSLFSLSLKQVDCVPARLTLTDADGIPRVYHSRLRQDVTLTLCADGSFSEDGFLLAGRRPLSPGMTITLTGTDLVVQGVLLRIERSTQDFAVCDSAECP